MKKITSVLFLVMVLVLLPGSTPASAQANPNQVLGPACTKLSFNMKLGSTDAMTNGEVTKLQEFYVHNGYLNMPANVAFGFFGPLTRQATIAFQNQYGIVPAQGFVGPITRVMIGHLTCVSAVPPVANPGVPVVPNNPVVQLNPGAVNNPNVFGLNPNVLNPANPVNPNPVNPVNPNPINPNPVNPVNPTLAVPIPNPNNPVPCQPPALFNFLTGAPCPPPNPVNPIPVNPVNPNPINPNPAVCKPTDPASITVTSPNGGESYMLNQPVDVTWTSCNLPVDTVRISLVNQTNNNPVTTVIYPMVNLTANDGSEMIKLAVPGGMPPFQLGNFFKIRIDLVPAGIIATPVFVTGESANFFAVN